MNEVVRIFEDA
jgi:vesicle-fusing ATPase